MTTLLILAAVTVAVTVLVLALLWVRDRLIDRWCEGFHYGLSDVTPADFDGPEPLPCTGRTRRAGRANP